MNVRKIHIFEDPGLRALVAPAVRSISKYK